MPRAFVGLGANVGDARGRLRWAEAELAALGVVRVSSLYCSAPVGPVKDQPFFLNAAAVLDTALDADALLTALLAIEARAGRDRTREQPMGPRPLDLDLLLVDDLVRVDPTGRLVLPHPRLAERAFALAPLVELAGAELIIPGAGAAGELLERALRTQRIARIV
jgi:2-amino-4-hydroxy-6-hydroxymethyldihydropteridine diphosphokinase